MWAPSLGREDPLDEGRATHSSTLVGKSHGQRSLADYSPWGCKRVGRDLATQQQSYMQLFEESNSSASLRSLTTFFISIPENLHISFF